MDAWYRFSRKAFIFTTALLLLLIVPDLLFFAPDVHFETGIQVRPPSVPDRWRNLIFGILFGIDIAFFGLWVFATGRLEARRERRRQLGLCLHCGYDIRASGDYCSECGRFINLDEHGKQL